MVRIGAHGSASERASDREKGAEERWVCGSAVRGTCQCRWTSLAASFPNGRRPPKIQQASLESRPIKPPAD
jgi:hypothetical protein